MRNILADCLAELRDYLKRKTCSHKGFREYEEIRTTANGKPSWSAMFSCSRCGEVLSVVAGYHGDPELVREALGTRDREGER